MVELPPGSRVEVRRGALPVLLARLPAVPGAATAIGASFTDRLVAKFGLPVAGWRGQAAARHAMAATGQREEGPGSDA
jgi:NAD+ kinase